MLKRNRTPPTSSALAASQLPAAVVRAAPRVFRRHDQVGLHRADVLLRGEPP